MDFPEPLRSMEDLRGNVDTLFARSELAALRGAQLVAWNEVATLVDPDEVPALEARAAELARRHAIDLVIAYGVVVSREPLLVDNLLRWFGPDGVALERQRKHFLPPGEPSIAGVEPLRVLDRPWGRAGGAICYDYDSPALARQHARGGAGLVVVPSSDWRGIDPQHTFMARVRAIEGGFSLVRPDAGGDVGRVRPVRAGPREPVRRGSRTSASCSPPFRRGRCGPRTRGSATRRSCSSPRSWSRAPSARAARSPDEARGISAAVGVGDAGPERRPVSRVAPARVGVRGIADLHVQELVWDRRVLDARHERVPDAHASVETATTPSPRHVQPRAPSTSPHSMSSSSIRSVIP